MRTPREHAARILHDQCVQNHASFYLIKQQSVRINPMKSGFFSISGLPADRRVSLDLGRFTKVIPAFFLKPQQRLTVRACSLLEMALHGFCTLFADSASPAPLSPVTYLRRPK